MSRLLDFHFIKFFCTEGERPVFRTGYTIKYKHRQKEYSRCCGGKRRKNHEDEKNSAQCVNYLCTGGDALGYGLAAHTGNQWANVLAPALSGICFPYILTMIKNTFPARKVFFIERRLSQSGAQTLKDSQTKETSVEHKLK